MSMPQGTGKRIQGESEGITVNPDTAERGKDAVCTNLDTEVAQKPGMTGNSDIVNCSADEIDIKTIRRKVQEMKINRDPGWKSEYVQLKTIRDQQEMNSQKE